MAPLGPGRACERRSTWCPSVPFRARIDARSPVLRPTMLPTSLGRAGLRTSSTGGARRVGPAAFDGTTPTGRLWRDHLGVSRSNARIRSMRRWVSRISALRSPATASVARAARPPVRPFANGLRQPNGQTIRLRPRRIGRPRRPGAPGDGCVTPGRDAWSGGIRALADPAQPYLFPFHLMPVRLPTAGVALLRPAAEGGRGQRNRSTPRTAGGET